MCSDITEIVFFNHALKQYRTYHATPTNNADLFHLLSLCSVIKKLNLAWFYIALLSSGHQK